MEYRKLGRTGLKASVIGFGAEWIGKMEQAEVNAMAARGAAAGVNIVDCWMSDPAVRSALGEALEPTRDQWIIQGHIGSTWQDGQYVRTRELNHVRPAFEDCGSGASTSARTSGSGGRNAICKPVSYTHLRAGGRSQV